jgi:hypothetical protein
VPGRTELSELRLFLGQLFLPKERIWFYPSMCEQIVDRYLADPAAMNNLKKHNLILDRFDWDTNRIVYEPKHPLRAWSTTQQSRRFDSIITRLQGLNELGYDIRICPNPLSFSRRCDLTVRGVRNVVLDNDGRNNPQWLDWLAHHRRHALAAVDHGNGVQINIRVNPIRNFRCIEKWQSLPDPDDEEDNTIEWPKFDETANEVEALTQGDGLKPHHRILRHFAGLIWCPGFVHALTGRQIRLLHPVRGEAEAIPSTAASAINTPTTQEVDLAGETQLAPTGISDLKPKSGRDPSRQRRKEPKRSRRRIAPPLVGQSRNIQLYCKVDAVKVLSPEFQAYADHANYIQHRILMGRMLGDLDETGDYTLLKSDYLRQVICAERLKPLLDEMQAVGLIERDDYYIVNRKSYGYRITDRYGGERTIRVACRRPRLSQRILSLRHEDFRHYKRVHKHLFKWLGHLDLDRLHADQGIEQTDFSGVGFPVEEMRDINRLAIQAILDRQWEFKVCDYGRVHTNITRLLKGVRNELRIDGQPLATIDIANSQPLFLLASMVANSGQPFLSTSDGTDKCIKNGVSRGDFWRRKSTHPPSGTYTTSFPLEPAPIEVLATSDRLPQDLNLYRTLCESGGLYDYLMERMGWTRGKMAFKDEELFRCLYGSNGPRDADGKHNPSRLQPVLETEFPTVWRFIRDWKRCHGYRDLACQMQRAESKLMIEGVCGRLMREHPDCPLVTIHDSIMTTAAWVEVVRDAILIEFGKIGIRPTLHVERSQSQSDSVGAAVTELIGPDCYSVNATPLAVGVAPVEYATPQA